MLGIGDVAMVTGVPSGGFSTTGFQCSSLVLDETGFYEDWWLRFYLGTHKDATRLVTTFTQLNGAFVFSPAVTGAIDATDLFELHRDFSPEEINNAINLAISMVETEALADKVDESLVVNDLLTDGLFELWTDSSTLINWTKGGTGTLTRESTIKVEGSYSAKLTNTVGNAVWLYQSISNPKLFAGQKASLYARVNTNTADRVRLSLTDGVTTWYSDYHDGTGWREAESDPWLSIENVTLSTALTALTASIRVETGAAIDAYVDKMWLVSGSKIYEYSIPTGFYTIDNIIPESSTVDRFNVEDALDARGWQILGTTTKKLWFDKNWVTLPSGRRLRLEGQQKPGQLSLDADTTDVSAAYIIQQAKALLHQSRVTGTGGVSERHDTQMVLAQGLADRERRKVYIAPRGQIV